MTKKKTTKKYTYLKPVTDKKFKRITTGKRKSVKEEMAKIQKVKAKAYRTQQAKIAMGELPTETEARFQNLRDKLGRMASKTMRKPPVKMPDVGQKKRMVVRIEQPPPGTIRFAFRQIYSRQTPYNSQNILEWGKKH